MIQTIYKGTDLVFNIKLEDKDGIPFRVRNTSEFILRLYTTNPAEFIECSFKDGDLTGIIEEDRIDKAVINSSDLDLSLIHIPSPRDPKTSRMPSSA